MIHPRVSETTQLLAWISGLIVGFGVAFTLYRILKGLRNGNAITRFVARVWIISGLYYATATTAVFIGGPYVMTGPSRHGYIDTPLTHKGIILISLIIGLFGASIFPFLRDSDQWDM